MPRIPVVLQKTPIGSTNPSATNAPTVGRSLPAPSRQMRGPALAREQFPQRAMNRTQSAARTAMSQATASDDAAANVIRGVTFAANVAQPLAHGLTDSKGRPIAWTSYRIENILSGFARFIAAHMPATDTALILVTADANCIADVRVW